MKKDVKWRAERFVDERYGKLLREIPNPESTSIADARVEISNAIGEMYRDGFKRGFTIAITKLGRFSVSGSFLPPKVDGVAALEMAMVGVDSVSADVFNLILERTDSTGILVSEAELHIKKVMIGVYLKAVDDAQKELPNMIRN
jgi:hypothetical protein